MKATSSRRRTLTLLLLPAIVFLWIIGWSLYWTGIQKTSTRQTPYDQHKDLEITVHLPQQEEYARM